MNQTEIEFRVCSNMSGSETISCGYTSWDEGTTKKKKIRKTKQHLCTELKVCVGFFLFIRSVRFFFFSDSKPSKLTKQDE